VRLGVDWMGISNVHEGGSLDASGLPPGFRFHPTDEELVSYYLTKKVINSSFAVHTIAEVGLNKFEPWDLPEKAKVGEKEWYFFSLRDRKYPTGMRTNRATDAGYWKATGKDRDVTNSRSHALVGMKKTLVFYRGRAPKGEKTKWIMHEYRLEGDNCPAGVNKDEWVVCRIFQKSSVARQSFLFSESHLIRQYMSRQFEEGRFSPSSVLDHTLNSTGLSDEENCTDCETDHTPSCQNRAPPVQPPPPWNVNAARPKSESEVLLHQVNMNTPACDNAQEGYAATKRNFSIYDMYDSIAAKNCNNTALLTRPVMSVAPQDFVQPKTESSSFCRLAGDDDESQSSHRDQVDYGNSWAEEAAFYFGADAGQRVQTGTAQSMLYSGVDHSHNSNNHLSFPFKYDISTPVESGIQELLWAY